jgi:hypothetical protein
LLLGEDVGNCEEPWAKFLNFKGGGRGIELVGRGSSGKEGLAVVVVAAL